MVTGLIFSTPASFEPSIPKLNGLFFQCSIKHLWQWGPIAILIIAEVFVWPEAYDAAILLSGNISLNNGPKWSAVAIGRLCCTRKLATITSALITFLLVESLGPASSCATEWVFLADLTLLV